MKGVIAFHGSDHRCGCSMISQCAAEIISKNYAEMKILLVHLQGRDGVDFSPRVRESMERIHPYLADRSLNADEIFEKAHWVGNLGIIAGVNDPGMSQDTDPERVREFLKEMRSKYDLVICDSGAELNNGLALGALISAQQVYMMLTPLESSLRHFEIMRPIYEKLRLPMNRFVINKSTNSTVYSPEYIAKRLGVDNSKLVKIRESKYGELAEMEEKALVRYKDNHFRKDVESFSRILLSDAGFEEEELSRYHVDL